jgi:hypothetical protein
MIARRIITRPCQPGGAEQHLSVTDDGFARLNAAGAFALTWASHGLRHGIGAEVRPWLAAGLSVVANGSRATLPQARAAFGLALRVVEITAPPEERWSCFFDQFAALLRWIRVSHQAAILMGSVLLAWTSSGVKMPWVEWGLSAL